MIGTAAKYIGLLIVVIALVLLLAGCGGTAEVAETPGAPSTDETAEIEQSEPVFPPGCEEFYSMEDAYYAMEDAKAEKLAVKLQNTADADTELHGAAQAVISEANGGLDANRVAEELLEGALVCN